MKYAEPVSIAVEGRSADILGDAVGEKQSAALAVFGQVDDALGESRGRVFDLDLDALEPESSRRPAVRIDQRAHGFRSSGPDETRQSENFPSPHLERDVTDGSETRQILAGEDDVADRRRAGRIEGGELPANHHLDQVVSRQR